MVLGKCLFGQMQLLNEMFVHFSSGKIGAVNGVALLANCRTASGTCNMFYLLRVGMKEK